MASTGGPVQPVGPPSGPVRRHRRGGFAGAIILIFLGLLFLAWNFSPNFNPWPVLLRYWPLILIFLGIGKIWDSYWSSHHPGEGPTNIGVGVAWIALLLLFIFAVWHGGTRWTDYDHGPYRGWGWNGGWNWDRRGWSPSQHDTQSVDPQGAKSVSADVNMPAGEMIISGGSNRLLDANFQYSSDYEKPKVTYEVSGGHGQLDVVQNSNGPNWGGTRDDEWTLRFGNVPLDLKMNLGAGHNDVRLDGMSVSHLEIHMGAGQLDLDLTGEQDKTMQTDIEGGVGQASIRIPPGQCVRAEASGGIGSISASGMQRQDGAYVSAACKSGAPEMDMTVHGGIGQINLVAE